jgi:hypothetical protein
MLHDALVESFEAGGGTPSYTASSAAATTSTRNTMPAPPP